MEQLKTKQDDITEEMISDLVTFLDNNPGTENNSKMAILYGRLRGQGMKLDRGEERIGKSIAKKREDYKWKIINQLKQGKAEIENENAIGGYNGHYEYQIANLKDWTKGRTMQLGFGDIDTDGKTKWRKSVEIEEWKNPEFFKEMLEKYLPSNDVRNERSKYF